MRTHIDSGAVAFAKERVIAGRVVAVVVITIARTGAAGAHVGSVSVTCVGKFVRAWQGNLT